MLVTARPRLERLSVSLDGAELSISINVRATCDDWIVFLHGLGCSKEAFDDAFHAGVLSSHSICALDFPGHGSSTSLDRWAYWLEAYAEVVHSVVAQLSPSRVFIVGHSMGGAVGLIAAQYLKQLAGFVSIEGNLVGEDCSLASREAARQSFEEFERQGHQAFLNGLRMCKRKDSAAWAQWYQACDPAAIHGSACGLVQWSESGKLLELFRAISRNAYCYGAEDDRVNHVLRLLSKSNTYPIPRSGHFPMVDNPSDLYGTLGEIVNQA